MLGVSALMSSSGAVEAESGGASGGSSELGASSSVPVEENERIGGGGGGNRWPRQETLALLKIRSDMDVTFRDASLKGPLWEEVSRKMAELGFQRSSKKCKEKFENVYKYHKRTKDGRASKSDGKTYRFFDQLAALENTSPNQHFSPPPPRLMAAPVSATSIPMPSHVATVPSASPTPLSVLPPKIVANSINSASFHQSQSQPPQLQHQHHPQPPPPLPPYSTSSSSTSSDEDIQRRRGKKRKWKDYFEKLLTEVVQKQEELQKKFLDTLERRERDRISREESWRLQEMARMNREHELLVQERSIAAAKDAAVIAFLQKVTGQTTLQIPSAKQQQQQPVASMPENPPSTPTPPPPPPQPQQSNLPPPLPPAATTPTPIRTSEINGGDDHISGSSSRWPKAEVEALIKLRTNLETKYQENGPKGPLWEDISKAMSNLGYSRSAKRCKEKWENINKYFKKVKEGSKKRAEDSKTCPYFHQLDAIYKERAKNHVSAFNYAAKPDHAMPPIMAQPEQQWPLPQDNDSGINHDGEDDDDDDDDEDEVAAYEMIANKQPSSVLTNTVE